MLLSRASTGSPVRQVCWPMSVATELLRGSGSSGRRLRVTRNSTLTSDGKGNCMNHYLFQAAYTSEAWETLIKHPQKRAEAARPTIQKMVGMFWRPGYALGRDSTSLWPTGPRCLGRTGGIKAEGGRKVGTIHQPRPAPISPCAPATSAPFYFGDEAGREPVLLFARGPYMNPRMEWPCGLLRCGRKKSSQRGTPGGSRRSFRREERDHVNAG